MLARYYVAFILIFISTAHGKVWITHGFGAEGADWYRDTESGDFYKALKETAAEHGHSVESFSWNQSPIYMGSTDREHRIGGFRLATAIADFCNTYTYNPAYPNDHIQIVVAHSFGGKVAYYCSNTLEKALINKDNSEEKKGFIPWLRKTFKNAFINQPNKAAPFISQLFTLGTPHSLPEEPASALSVKKVYNIYSQADCVAHDFFAGSPLLTADMQKNHPYAFNVCLLGKTNGIIHAFGHSEIHDPEVARALFDIANHVDNRSKLIRNENHNHATYCILMPEKPILNTTNQEYLDSVRARIMSAAFNPTNQLSSYFKPAN